MDAVSERSHTTSPFVRNTRRDFLRYTSLAAITSLFSCQSQQGPDAPNHTAGSNVPPPPPEEREPPGVDMQKLIERMKHSPSCQDIWSYPHDAIEKNTFQNPLLFIPYDHVEFDREPTEAQLDVLRHTLHLHLEIQQNGVKHFSFEGLDFRKSEGNLLDRPDLPLNHEQFAGIAKLRKMSAEEREAMRSTQEGFRSMFNLVGKKLPLLIALELRKNKDTTCTGSENPSTYRELNRFLRERLEPAFQKTVGSWKKVLSIDGLEKSNTTMTKDPHGHPLIYTIGETNFAVDEIYNFEELLELYALIIDSKPSAASRGMSAQHREDFAAGTLPKEAALLLGARHAPHFSEYAQKRTIIIMEPTGTQKEMYDEPAAMKKLKMFMRRIEADEKKIR